MYCQLAYLRYCLPGRIRRALDELPKSLDETYERTLEDIGDQNWEYAHRLFQCVAAASRPLSVAELAEFLAFDFEAESTPEYLEEWRPEDPGHAVFSTCSSLLAVVNVDVIGLRRVGRGRRQHAGERLKGERQHGVVGIGRRLEDINVVDVALAGGLGVGEDGAVAVVGGRRQQAAATGHGRAAQGAAPRGRGDHDPGHLAAQPGRGWPERGRGRRGARSARNRRPGS